MNRPEDPEIQPGMDADLASLLRDAIDGVDDAIVREGGMPDFAAMIALANRIDPARVGPDAVAEAAALATVVPLSHGRRRARTRDDPDLSAIVDEVRAHVEQRVTAELSSPPVIVAKPRVHARRVWAGVLAAAASVVLVVLGVAKAAEILGREDDDDRHDAAQHEQVPRAQSESRARVIDETTPPARTEIAPAPEAVEIAPVPVPPSAAKPERSKRKRSVAAAVDPPATPAEPTLEDRLAALDREAHAAWRAGDRATAESKFRSIVELAGKRRIADLAYGDLFTLARQSGKEGNEDALWREYLQRFAHGRFADDARAGLCRRVADGDARACWADYLRDFPEGSFRRQAERVLEETH